MSSLLYLLLAFLCLWAVPAHGQEIPTLVAPITDLAQVLDPEAEEALTARILAHRERTGVQLAVLTVDTTGGVPIEDYSLRVAETWGGGTRGRDDGVLHVLAVKDRRQRLEVGYGLEPALPDMLCQRILDETRQDLVRKRYGPAVETVVARVEDATRDAESGAIPASARVFKLLRALLLPVPWLLGFLMGGIPFVFRRIQGWRRAGIVTASLLVVGSVGTLLMPGEVPTWDALGVGVGSSTLGYFTAICLGDLLRPVAAGDRDVARWIFNYPGMVLGGSGLIALLVLAWQWAVGTLDGLAFNHWAVVFALVGPFTTLFPGLPLLGVLDGGDGGTSYRSSPTPGHRPNPSPSHSSSTGSTAGGTYSGGGGRFGGGGASSSW